ncbi:MAG: hypothetical protein V7636_1066 [Actinomycetota bacterium]|jgi:ketosteroid isomerase-like protein
MTTTETTALETSPSPAKVAHVIDTYFAAWNEADPAKRLDLVAASFTDECHYVDPLSDVTGHAGVVEMMEGVRAQFVGASLQQTGEIDAHHHLARFPWSATGADGAVIVAGIDVVVLATDGRISALAGFFG